MRKDGTSEREHLEAATRSPEPYAALARAELAGPEFPEACAHVWTWFCQLLAKRSFSVHGAPNPISWEAIASWAWLTRSRPTPWEVDLLCALDLAWLTRKDGHGRDGDGAPRPG